MYTVREMIKADTATRQLMIAEMEKEKARGLVSKAKELMKQSVDLEVSAERRIAKVKDGTYDPVFYSSIVKKLSELYSIEV